MKRRYADGIRFAIVCAGGVLIDRVMKLFFAKPRPELWQRLITETSFSFPSGHAVGSMVVYGFIAYILAKEMQQHKHIVYAAASLVIIAILFLQRLRQRFESLISRSSLSHRYYCWIWDRISLVGYLFESQVLVSLRYDLTSEY